MVSCFTPPFAPVSRSAFVPALGSHTVCRPNTAVPAPRVTMPTSQVETYENRSFATPLPRTWEGDVPSFGVSDVEPSQTTDDTPEDTDLTIIEDDESPSALAEFIELMKEERKQILDEQARRNSVVQTGRPTCGPSEGREVVSNFQPIYMDGTKCVEYWGAPNGPVPRLFG